MAMANFALLFNLAAILFKLFAVILFFKYFQKLIRILEEIRDKKQFEYNAKKASSNRSQIENFDKCFQEEGLLMLKIVNVLLAIFIIFTVWIPYTRIFMTDIGWGTIVVFLASMALCYTSMDRYRKDKSKLSIVTLIIGLSPFILIFVVFLLAFIIKPAP